MGVHNDTGPTSTPPFSRKDPVQIVIDLNPPMSAATESKKAIISLLNIAPGKKNTVGRVLFGECLPEICNMKIAVRHYELEFQQGNI